MKNHRYLPSGSKEKNKGLELSEKQLYMTTTYERVVPLTHYLWTSCAPSVIQSHKGTPMEYKLREVINKPLQVAMWWNF